MEDILREMLEEMRRFREMYESSLQAPTSSVRPTPFNKPSRATSLPEDRYPMEIVKNFLFVSGLLLAPPAQITRKTKQAVLKARINMTIDFSSTSCQSFWSEHAPNVKYYHIPVTDRSDITHDMLRNVCSVINSNRRQRVLLTSLFSSGMCAFFAVGYLVYSGVAPEEAVAVLYKESPFSYSDALPEFAAEAARWFVRAQWVPFENVFSSNTPERPEEGDARPPKRRRGRPRLT